MAGSIHELHLHRKVEQIALGLPTDQQVRALAHSAPALQLDDLACVFDSTSLPLASDHPASAFESTILVVVVEDLFQSDVLPALFVWSSSPLISMES